MAVLKLKTSYVAKQILYKDKTIDNLCEEFNLSKSRVRQLLWIGLRDMKNKSIKCDE